nr:sigma-70 family RNA polymerase sigma factor [Streptomyces sp. CB02959]
MTPEREAAVVAAAQAGDQQAQDELVAAYLPLVYNIVGRALHGHADADDVVQETMLRVLDGMAGLRKPHRFRSWLVSVTMNEIRRHWRSKQASATGTGVDEVTELADPGADFVDLTIIQLGLSGQRQEVAEATRWLDEDDRALLSLWWLEAAGELTRSEVAAALKLPARFVAVRVQRMKAQLETARVVVRALSATSRCPRLEPVVARWDGVPSALWRKRISRHVRDCRACSGRRNGLIPAQRLFVGIALVPPSAAVAWSATQAGHSAAAFEPAAQPTGARGGHASTTPQTAGRHAAHPWVAELGTLPLIEGTVIHLRVEHLPSGAIPKPVWLWWSGTDATPTQVDLLWQVFLRRFDIEHTFRLFKQTLGWTRPKIRTPETADRWTWLILAAYTQLRLARPLAADLRRPWEKPNPSDRLTPARVRRDFRHLRPKTLCPAEAPKASRPGPGRPPGRKNTHPTPRHDVHTVRKTDTTKRRTKKSTTPRPRRKG